MREGGEGCPSQRNCWTPARRQSGSRGSRGIDVRLGIRRRATYIGFGGDRGWVCFRIRGLQRLRSQGYGRAAASGLNLVGAPRVSARSRPKKNARAKYSDSTSVSYWSNPRIAQKVHYFSSHLVCIFLPKLF